MKTFKLVKKVMWEIECQHWLMFVSALAPAYSNDSVVVNMCSMVCTPLFQGRYIIFLTIAPSL
jgi:hypothetical protein